MNRKSGDWERSAGFVAYGLLMAASLMWVFWGVAEMFYEGWWGPFGNRLFYLIPGTVCILLTLAALASPKWGGWLTIIIGGGFTLWWWGSAALRGHLTWRRVISQFPVSGIFVLTGVLLLMYARNRTKLWQGKTLVRGKIPLRYAVGIGLPLLIVVAECAYNLPIVLSRVDDGNTSARLIARNGVRLIWAPLGAGWNWHPEDRAALSWREIALYGVEPVGVGEKASYIGRHAGEVEMATYGLCRYVSEDGRMLMDEPQGIWRMPRVDEIVRSLALHGNNAGCSWKGKPGWADCLFRPDKETPLWAPQMSTIYLWAAEAYDDERAYYVSYNGVIKTQPKTWGNPRHGYRCVREP